MPNPIHVNFDGQTRSAYGAQLNTNSYLNSALNPMSRPSTPYGSAVAPDPRPNNSFSQNQPAGVGTQGADQRSLLSRIGNKKIDVPSPNGPSDDRQASTQGSEAPSGSWTDTLKRGASLAWQKILPQGPSADDRAADQGAKARTDGAAGDLKKLSLDRLAAKSKNPETALALSSSSLSSAAIKDRNKPRDDRYGHPNDEPATSSGSSSKDGGTRSSLTSAAGSAPPAHYEAMKAQAERFMVRTSSRDWRFDAEARGKYADMMYRGAQSAGDGKSAYLEAWKKDREAQNRELLGYWQADKKGFLGKPEYRSAEQALEAATQGYLTTSHEQSWLTTGKPVAKASQDYSEAVKNYLAILEKADIHPSTRDTLQRRVVAQNRTVWEDGQTMGDARQDARSAMIGVLGYGRDLATIGATLGAARLAGGEKNVTAAASGATAGAAMDLLDADASGRARLKDGASFSDNFADYFIGAGRRYESQNIPSSLKGAGIGLGLANAPAPLSIGAGAIFTKQAYDGTRNSFQNARTEHAQLDALKKSQADASVYRKTLQEAIDKSTREGRVDQAQELSDELRGLDSGQEALSQQIDQHKVSAKTWDNNKWLQAAETAFSALGTGYGAHKILGSSHRVGFSNDDASLMPGPSTPMPGSTRETFPNSEGPRLRLEEARNPAISKSAISAGSRDYVPGDNVSVPRSLGGRSDARVVQVQGDRGRVMVEFMEDGLPRRKFVKFEDLQPGKHVAASDAAGQEPPANEGSANSAGSRDYGPGDNVSVPRSLGGRSNARVVQVQGDRGRVIVEWREGDKSFPFRKSVPLKDLQPADPKSASEDFKAAPAEAGPLEQLAARKTAAVLADKARLEGQGVASEIAYRNDEPYLIINKDGNTNLGRIAKKLEEKMGVKMVYNRGELEKMNAVGFFDPTEKAIYVSHNQISFPHSLNDNTLHEISHAHTDNAHGVLEGSAYSEGAMPDHNNNSGHYQKMQGLDEPRAQTKNIAVLESYRKNAMAAKNPDGAEFWREQISDRAGYTQGLAERSQKMTQYGLDSVDHAIGQIKQGAPSGIQFIDGKAIVPVRSDGLAFRLEIPLSAEEFRPGDDIHNLQMVKKNLSAKSSEYQKIMENMRRRLQNP